MIYQIDQSLFIFLNQQLHNPLLDRFFPFITNAGNFKAILIFAAIFIFWKGKWPLRITLLLSIFSLIISSSISEILKETICRVRPLWVIENTRLLVGGTHSYSFPSAHASSMFSVVSIFIYRYRDKKWLTGILLSLALLVSYSRIYVGVHYPLDVLGGIIIGLLTGIFILYFYQKCPFLEYDQQKSRVKVNYQSAFYFSFILLTFFRLSYIASGSRSLTPEETQYWDWSRNLDWSYYSKPPLIAYLIHLFTVIGKSSAFFVRLGSVLIFSVLGIITYKFCLRLIKDTRIAFWCFVVFNLIPLFSAGALLMTTDTPLALFWGLTVYALYIALFENKPSWWYLTGLFFGLGMLSKYTMALLAPGILLFLLLQPENRKWLCRKEPYLAGLIALFCFLPVIYWNYAHDWVTFKHVAGQAHVNEGFILKWKYCLDFVGSQAGVISPFVFLAMLYYTYKAIRRYFSRTLEAKELLLLCLSVPVFLFFLFKSMQGKVEANWVGTGYYTWIMFLVIDFEKRRLAVPSISRKKLNILAISSLLVAFLITLVMHDSSIIRSLGINLPPKKDPTSRLYGWDDLGTQVSQIKSQMPSPDSTFVFSDYYQLSAELAFYTEGQPRVYCINLGRRMNQYDLWENISTQKGRDGLFVTNGRHSSIDSRITSSFDKIESPIIIQTKRKGLLYQEFTVVRCYGFHGTILDEHQTDRY